MFNATEMAEKDVFVLKTINLKPIHQLPSQI